MDLQQYWLALKARRKAFFMVFAFTVVAAIVVSLAVPKRYDAVATVLIDAPDPQTMTTEARISPRERAGYMMTQVELIRSGTVAERVARDLKLAQRPGARDEWESDTGGIGTLDEWLAKKLLEKLKVDNGAANIISITFSSNDRKYSAAVANAFARAYLETSLEMRTEPSRAAATWFEGQLKALRADVMQAQTRLTAYQKKTGVIGTDRADIEYTRLAELSTALSGARNGALEAEARYRQAREAASTAGAAAELPEVLSNPYIITVKTALQGAEGRLEDLSRELGKNHPQYQRAALEVQTLRERLNGETKKLIASLGNAAAQAKKREQELGAAVVAQQQRIVQTRDASVEMAVLTRDLESAQRAYDGAMQRYIATKVESRARQTNLALLTPAVEPVEAAAPRIGLISGLSVLIGLLLAAGIVYLLEMTDRRVRSRNDLEQKLAIPSLGNLSKWLPSGGRLLPSPQYAAGGGAAPPPPPPPPERIAMLVKPSDNVLPIDGTTRNTGRPIGAILMDEGKLTPSDAEQVLKRQRELGWRFGEAAIELNLITDTDLREALAKQYEFPYLVGGPEGVAKELIAAWDPFHPMVEELRAVRTQLLIRWFNPQAGRRTLVIASPGAREGRSFVAANLAVVFSQLGHRTLLVDADFRAPRQQSIFNIADRFGLSSVLSGRADLSAAVPVAGLTGLAVLPCGPVPPNPLELLSRGSFPALLGKAQAEYDVILIDTPPASEYADAQSIAFRAGDVLLLSRRHHTRVDETERAVRELSDASARVVGTLMNSF